MDPTTDAPNGPAPHRIPNASLAPQLTQVPAADLPWDIPKLHRAVVRAHAYETVERPRHRELGVTEGTVRDTPHTPVVFKPARVRQYIEIARSLNQRATVPRHGDVEDATQTLRGFVQSMAPYAEVRATALVDGSPEWRSCRETIERARRVSAAAAGDGLRAATDHIVVLAGAVEDLLLHAEQYAQEVQPDG
ncbi:DUF6415 family natural product biosynthesis protein [Streptomyces sp. NPDC054933]